MLAKKYLNTAGPFRTELIFKYLIHNSTMQQIYEVVLYFQ